MKFDGWYDYFLVVSAAFSLAGWGTFVIGFGLESSNPARMADDGLWDSSVKRFDWYVLAVMGVVACVLEILYGLTKNHTIFLLVLFFSSIALTGCGGAMSSTGRFIWECNQPDSNGDRRQPPGCQEETFDNYSLTFVGCVVIFVCQLIAILTAAQASHSSKFSFHNPRLSVADADEISLMDSKRPSKAV
eukprot:m.25351 g.25351  ORF g.25351 m.25351 type:complete len:189 (-) comp5755_c2_seq1:37-603(-)